MSLKAARESHRNGVEDHPSIERLKAYHLGQLKEDEEDGIQEHFIACSGCREIFLDLVDFLDGTPVEGRWDPEDLVQEWRKMSALLAEEGLLAKGV